MWAPDPPPSRRPSVSVLLAFLFASTTCYLLFVSIHAPQAQQGIQLLTQQDSSSPSSLRSSTLLIHDPDDDLIPNIHHRHDDEKDEDASQIRRRDEEEEEHKNHDNDDQEDEKHSKMRRIHDEDEEDGDKHSKKSSNKKSSHHDDDDEDRMKNKKKNSKLKKNKRDDKKDVDDDDDDDDDDDKVDGKNQKNKRNDDEEDDTKNKKNNKNKNKNKNKKNDATRDEDEGDDDHVDEEHNNAKNENKQHDDEEKDKGEQNKKDKKHKKNNKKEKEPNNMDSKKPIQPSLQQQKGDTRNPDTRSSQSSPTSSPTLPPSPSPSPSSSSSSSSSRYRILFFGDSITAGTGPTPRHPYSIRLLQLMNGAGIQVETTNVGIDGNCVIQDPDPNRPAMVYRITRYLPMTSTNPLHQRRLFIELASSSMKQDDKPIQHGPFDMVILLGGTNDLSHFHPPQDILNGLLSIHERIRRSGAITVAITIPERAYEIQTKPPYLYQRGQDMAGEQYYARRMIINEGLQRYCQYHEPTKNGRTANNEMPCLLVDMGHEILYATDPDQARARASWSDVVHPSAAGYDRLGELIWAVISPHLDM